MTGVHARVRKGVRGGQKRRGGWIEASEKSNRGNLSITTFTGWRSNLAWRDPSDIREARVWLSGRRASRNTPVNTEYFLVYDGGNWQTVKRFIHWHKTAGVGTLAQPILCVGRGGMGWGRNACFPELNARVVSETLLTLSKERSILVVFFPT